MVNIDGLLSALFAWIKITLNRTIRGLRTGTANAWKTTHPKVETIIGASNTKLRVIGGAVRLKLNVVRSTLGPKLKVVSDAVSPKIRIVSDAVSPKVKIVSDAVSPRLKIVSDAVSPKLKIVRDAVSPPIRAFNAASPKVKAICASCTFGLLAAIVAPIAVTESGHDAYAAENLLIAPDGITSLKSYGQAAAKAPTFDQLHSTGIQGPQSDLSMSTDQMRNAQKIIQAGQAMGLPARAWVIAVATSMQETKLTNVGYLGGANDYDSLGLFQQRPSSGWGSPDQLLDPTYAAKAFYTALTNVPGWDRINLTDAAQAVQVSAFGFRYAQWEAKAGDVVEAFYGQGPLAHLANQVM